MDGLLASVEVDLCLVPSEWVRDLYQLFAPALSGRIAVWAAGVDTRRWIVPSKPFSREHPVVLLYVKNGMCNGEIAELNELLLRMGFKVARLAYGAYDATEYLNLLGMADLCVFISASESQGIALQEAWSCDKPTWVFDPGYWSDPSGSTYTASSAPYLTDDCGHRFANLLGLEALCNQWRRGDLRYSPRAWTLTHMTDAICAQNLLALLLDQDKLE